jgi:UDP-GlcNAc:undecaprenyl-phosphate GlcNAc-1-phosphate transferase
MLALCLMLVPLALLIALPATLAARVIGHRLAALDGSGVAGQVKAPSRRVPNTGGIGIVLGIATPLAAALGLVKLGMLPQIVERFPALAPHAHGLERQSTAGLVLLTSLLALHILGLIDDRRPLRAAPKLLVILGLSLLAAWGTDSRLLTMLDAHAGGAWLSLLITVLWIGVITNAFNFLDNMDGLSAGVAAIAAGFFLTVTLVSPTPQWFVGAMLALLIGSLLGFLAFNFPFKERRRGADGTTSGGASIFMGDSGSLVIGFLLAVLSVRITYVPASSEPALHAWDLNAAHTPAAGRAAWHGVLIPLIILAVPLYDFCSVCLIRIRQGRSPFVGDLQHFSHRLSRHGLSARSTVLVIYACAAITGIGAVALPRLDAWQAALVGVQTLLVLSTIAAYELARIPDNPGRAG